MGNNKDKIQCIHIAHDNKKIAISVGYRLLGPKQGGQRIDKLCSNAITISDLKNVLHAQIHIYIHKFLCPDLFMGPLVVEKYGL